MADNSFEHLTPRARQIILLANKESERLNHDHIGTVHLLLGILALGEGVAVDFAEQINNVIPMGYFMSNMTSNFLIDFADKALVTALSLIIYKLLPSSVLDYVQTRSWYYVTLIERHNPHNRKRLS